MKLAALRSPAGTTEASRVVADATGSHAAGGSTAA